MQAQGGRTPLQDSLPHTHRAGQACAPSGQLPLPTLPLEQPPGMAMSFGMDPVAFMHAAMAQAQLQLMADRAQKAAVQSGAGASEGGSEADIEAALVMQRAQQIAANFFKQVTRSSMGFACIQLPLMPQDVRPTLR